METHGFRRIFSSCGQALFNHLAHIAGLLLERLSQREFEFVCILGLCKIEALILFVFWVSARLKLVNMAGESSSNLPAGWVQGTERKEDGTEVKQQAAIAKPTARSLNGRVMVARTRKPPRCSKCGKIGHNCRSCHEPSKSLESPKPM